MNKRNVVATTTIALAVAFVLLSIGITLLDRPTTKGPQRGSIQKGDPGPQSQGSIQTPTAPDTTIIDAAGRPHKVMPMRQITHEQRKAAADRAKGARASGLGHRKLTAPGSTGEVTQ